MSKMILHCGGKNAELAEVLAVETPAPTRSHQPIPHAWFLEEIRAALETVELEATDWQYALNHQGQQLFALARVRGDLVQGRDEGVIGARNAHDKVFKAGLTYGRRVFLCDNLGFGGEITVGRKHTPGILDELPDLLCQAAAHLGGVRNLMEGRYDAYQGCWVTDQQADELFGQLVRRRISPDQAFLYRAMAEWDDPRHDEFRERTVWSWFNACTEAFKDCGIPNPGRTMRLHQIADEAAGITRGEAEIVVN